MYIKPANFFKAGPHFRHAAKYKENITNSSKLQKIGYTSSKIKWQFLKRKKTSYSLTDCMELSNKNYSVKRLSQAFANKWKTKHTFKQYYQVPKDSQWSKHFSYEKKLPQPISGITYNKSKSLLFNQKIIRAIQNFESRLDHVIWKSKLAPTVLNARQLISHGFIHVNKNKSKLALRILKPGDVISLQIDQSTKKKMIAFLQRNKLSRNFVQETVPYNLEISYKNLTVIYTQKPQPDYIQYPFLINPSLLYLKMSKAIISYY